MGGKHIFNSKFSEGKSSSKKNFHSETDTPTKFIITVFSKSEEKEIMRRNSRPTGLRFSSEGNDSRV